MSIDHVSSTIYRYNGMWLTALVSLNLLTHITSNCDDGVSVDIGGPQHISAPAKLDIMSELQERGQPNIFNPRGAYDGKKSLFTSHRLKLEDDDSHTFEVSGPNGPRTNQVKVTLVAEMDVAKLPRWPSENSQVSSVDQSG